MWLSKTGHLINGVISAISGWINSVGKGILAAMMFLTFADVSLRYVFNRPLTGSYELTEYMMVILVGFGIAYCAVVKGHITIDIVVSRFPQRTQAIIDSVTCLIGLGLFSLITWQCALHLKGHFEAGVASVVLLIPTFPFIAALTLGSAMFCLVLLTHLVEFLSQAVRK